MWSISFDLYSNISGSNYNAQWRIALAMGAVPMVIAFYFRWKMQETTWAKEQVLVIMNFNA
jgi:hypothetical protein